MVVIVIIQMNLGLEIMEANVATTGSFSCVIQYLFWANKNAFSELHAHHEIIINGIDFLVYFPARFNFQEI